MSNYTKLVNFAAKDTLPTGDAAKVVRGTEINTEFTNIATAVNSKADIASPTFTGTPSAPTASAGTNTTQLATTAYVYNLIGGLTATTTELNVLDGITATTAELNYVDGVTSGIQAQLNAKAGLDSPALTGTPTAPTAANGTDTTQLATTAFVANAVTEASSGISGLTASAAELNILDGATLSTTELNYVDGVTGGIQGQLDAKLARASNLSDLANAETARTNLGLGTAAVTDSTAYATSAQGALADSALQSFTESDPTVPAHVKSITTTNVSNWNTAYGWGDHALAGYLTSVASNSIDADKLNVVGNGTAGYALTSDGDGSFSWTAIATGGLGSVVEDTTPQLGGTLDANGNTIDMGVNVITDTAVGNWNTAYSWGDHAGLYANAAHGHVISDITNLQTELDTLEAATGFYATWNPVSKALETWYTPSTDVVVRIACATTGYYSVDVGSSTTTYKTFGYKGSGSNGSQASAQIPVAAGQYYRVRNTFSTAPTVWETRI